MNEPNDAKSLPNRRAILRDALAGIGYSGFLVSFLGGIGCQQVTLPAVIHRPARRPATGPRADELAFRLYGIRMEGEQQVDLQLLADLGVPLLPVFLRDTWQNPDPNQLTLAVWATEAEAQQIAAAPGVESVYLKEPKNVAEIGSPDQARMDGAREGQLAVRLMPVPETHPNLGRECANLPRIAETFQSWAGDDGTIRVELGPEPVVPEDVGEIADAGQIVIRFTSDELDSRFLKRVLGHPQVVAIRWGSVFCSLYCPPCGMG